MGSPPPLDPVALYNILHRCWSAETGGKWLADNPARGQCSVTALVVQDLLGGEILTTEIDGAWHFYNRIAGRRWDLTMGQFNRPIGYDDLPSSRDEALSDTSPERYGLLRRLVLRSIEAPRISVGEQGAARRKQERNPGPVCGGAEFAVEGGER